MVPRVDSGRIPEVQVNPHMIALLDQPCRDCRQMSISYKIQINGSARISSCYHLQKVTSSAMPCPLCVLARMIWAHFSKDAPPNEVRIFSIRQWSPRFLTLRLSYYEAYWSPLPCDEDGHECDETIKDNRQWESIQLSFTGMSEYPVPNSMV